jgi:hypothetical protein
MARLPWQLRLRDTKRAEELRQREKQQDAVLESLRGQNAAIRIQITWIMYRQRIRQWCVDRCWSSDSARSVDAEDDSEWDGSVGSSTNASVDESPDDEASLSGGDTTTDDEELL